MLADRLGRLIKEEKKITIVEASRRSGVPVPSITKLLRAERTDPHMSTLVALAVGLDVSIDYLAGIKDRVSKNGRAQTSRAQGRD